MSKPKMLMWSDFGLAGTGFGTVSKHVIAALKDQFEIDHLAINYNGEFFDKEKMPIQVSSAKILNPQDPYGNQMFLNAVITGKYDYVWIMNDTFVVEKVARELPKAYEALASKKMKRPKVVYYYPIDCQVIDTATTMLKVADHIVAYCKFGEEETLKKVPELKSKLSIINHGVDVKSFHKINKDERSLYRQEFFGVKDDNTFVWMNANRNNGRKNIAQTIVAFSKFREVVKNSKLYLHTAVRDSNIDLAINVKHLGLEMDKDVVFARNYGAHKPYPVEIFNGLYNASDAFITTTYGEGWGLTHLDAMLVGLPVVAPHNTCFPEQLAEGDRGYLYPCKELIWADNSGYRPMGRIDDVVNSMLEAHKERVQGNTSRTSKAKQYALSLEWSSIGKQWQSIFAKVKNTAADTKVLVESL